MTIDALRTQQEEWGLFQADPRSVFESIDSGLRKSTVSCQYFVSNLPDICSFWVNGDPGHCSYGEEDGQTGVPSGYNNGLCDFLGRRNWCDKYNAPKKEDESDSVEEVWFCCAPDPFRTGLTKPVNVSDTSDISVRPLKKSEIEGYCEKDGIGKCDGWGCGRGCMSGGNIKDLLKKPIICSYYKPWRMGFGAIEPQTYKSAIKEYGAIYDEAYEGFLKRRVLGKRLPLSFEIYNLRAKLQPCVWWQGSPGVFVYPNTDEDADYITLTSDPGFQCKCTDPSCFPYKTTFFSESTTPQWLLQGVWSTGETVLCNGANPECPCYSGSWEFCIDSKMYPGMKLTAYQILELRFWTYPWKSQEQYDKFFTNRPNWSDPTTSDIFTFSRWDKSGSDASESVAIGKRFRLIVDTDSGVCVLDNLKFNPDVSIEEKEIKYAKYSIEGTTTDDQVHYPTLVRPLWDFEYKILYVLFPYVSKQSEPCLFYSNLMNYCFISSVGYTEKNCDVYFINASFVELYNVYLSNYDYTCILDIPKELIEDFYVSIKKYLYDCEFFYPNYVVKTTSDMKGVYLAKLLRSEYNQPNAFYIIVDLGDGTYLFEKRYIIPTFCGGIVTQTGFLWKPSGDVYVPTIYSPSASATFFVQHLGGSVFSEVYLISSHNSEFSNMYTYSIDKIELNGVYCNRWAPVGPSNYLWVEVEDSNLNYILKWEFVKGTIYAIDKKGLSYNLDVEVVFPLDVNSELKLDGSEYRSVVTSSLGITLERLSFPPNAILLRPKPDQANSNIGLASMVSLDIVIDYTYYKFVNSDSNRSNTVFPEGEVEFYDHRSLLNYDSNEGGPGAVSNIVGDTVGLLALFKAPDDRYVSAFATKLFTNLSEIFCRSVEIYYKYKSNANAYELMPTLGSFANAHLGKRPAGSNEHVEIAPCGDHECGEPCIGPMWFPYLRCSDSKKYRFKAGAASCYMYYEGEGAEDWTKRAGFCSRLDFRYCLTKHYEAWSGLSSPMTCRVEWELFYSKKTGNDMFAGYANAVAWVDEKEYVYHSWSLPPFGNYGRDFIERYMSVDHSSFKKIVRGIPVEKWEWMPYAIDNSSFYFSFNCFDTFSTTDTQDCFSYVSQMNFFLATFLEETIQRVEMPEGKVGTSFLRFSWDELFSVYGVAGYYPKPIVVIGETAYAYFYIFNENKYCWAWIENWRDIIRALVYENEVNESLTKLGFLKILKPSYRYDDQKKQHRFICEEGEYYIRFNGPEYEQGKITKLPGLTLLKEESEIGHTRYFEILYDNVVEYNLTSIEWNDEGDGSSEGSVAGNIYEETSSTPWINYPNMLFAYDESSSVPDKNRTYYMAVMGEWGEFYYNRGLIINMLKADILRLPTDEFVAPYTIDSQSEISEEINIEGAGIFAVRRNGHTLNLIISDSDEGALCISRIVVKGKWGFLSSLVPEVNDIYISKAGLSVSYASVSGKYFTLTESSFISPLNKGSSAVERNSLVYYELEYKIPITPKYVIVDRALTMEIGFIAANNEGLYIDSIELYCVEYSKFYKERLYVYEQKFIVSEYVPKGKNIYGPDCFLSNREGATPKIPPRTAEDGFCSANKLRLFGTGERFDKEVTDSYGSRSPIDITIDNLYEVEYDLQEEIYTTAYNYDYIGDVLKYSFVVPEIMKSPNNEHLYDIVIFNDFNCVSKRLEFKNHGLALKYIPYSFWSPGGHYWEWGSNYEERKCYLFGSKVWKIYSQRVVHHLHSGGKASVMDPVYLYEQGSMFDKHIVWLDYDHP